MKLPNQAKPVMRNVSTARIEKGVNASDPIQCILTKCLPCAALAEQGNFVGAIACAIANCPQCLLS